VRGASTGLPQGLPSIKTSKLFFFLNLIPMIPERVPCGYYKFVNKKARGLYEKESIFLQPMQQFHVVINTCKGPNGVEMI
jgi:hypothetical protein